MQAETGTASAPREWVISDTRGLEYHLVADCDDEATFAATLRDHYGRTAGHVAWRCHPTEAVQLEDLSIEKRIPPLGLKEDLRRILRREPRTRTYRGLGLGSMLLQIAIVEARAAHASRIYGYLCQNHLDETPDLPRWFWHRGFVVTDPPAGTAAGSVQWVYMDLPN